MKGVGFGKSIGNSFGNLKCICFFFRNFGPDRDVFNQGGVFGGAHKKLRGVFWPNLVGAFKVVLPGNGLGKPDVFNQGGLLIMFHHYKQLQPNLVSGLEHCPFCLP